MSASDQAFIKAFAKESYQVARSKRRDVLSTIDDSAGISLDAEAPKWRIDNAHTVSGPHQGTTAAKAQGQGPTRLPVQQHVQQQTPMVAPQSPPHVPSADRRQAAVVTAEEQQALLSVHDENVQAEDPTVDEEVVSVEMGQSGSEGQVKMPESSPGHLQLVEAADFTLPIHSVEMAGMMDLTQFGENSALQISVFDTFSDVVLPPQEEAPIARLHTVDEPEPEESPESEVEAAEQESEPQESEAAANLTDEIPEAGEQPAEPLAEEEVATPALAIHEPKAAAIPPRPAELESPSDVPEDALIAASRLAEPESPAATVLSSEFSPEWEVDQFQWPSICSRLMQHRREYFAKTGQGLVSATTGKTHVLAVTSAHRQEGRTTLTLCLAKCAAEAGARVALIDCDTFNPELADCLGLEVTHGWPDAFAGTVPLSETAIVSLEENITLFPIHRLARRLADLPLSEALRAIEGHYDLILLDMPATSDDSSVAHPAVALDIQTAIVIRDIRSGDDSDSSQSVDQLRRAGVEAIGVAENFSRAA